MKHLQAGLLVGLASAVIGAGVVIIWMLAAFIGPIALVPIGLFVGVTIIAAIIDWKTEKK